MAHKNRRLGVIYLFICPNIYRASHVELRFGGRGEKCRRKEWGADGEVVGWPLLWKGDRERESSQPVGQSFLPGDPRPDPRFGGHPLEPTPLGATSAAQARTSEIGVSLTV